MEYVYLKYWTISKSGKEKEIKIPNPFTKEQMKNLRLGNAGIKLVIKNDIIIK